MKQMPNTQIDLPNSLHTSASFAKLLSCPIYIMDMVEWWMRLIWIWTKIKIGIRIRIKLWLLRLIQNWYYKSNKRNQWRSEKAFTINLKIFYWTYLKFNKGNWIRSFVPFSRWKCGTRRMEFFGGLTFESTTLKPVRIDLRFTGMVLKRPQHPIGSGRGCLYTFPP